MCAWLAQPEMNYFLDGTEVLAQSAATCVRSRGDIEAVQAASCPNIWSAPLTVISLGMKFRWSSRNWLTNGTLTATGTEGIPRAATTGRSATSARVPAETPP